MCRTLSDPPKEFAPKELLESLELVVSATQLEHGVSLTITLKPLTVVAAQVLLLLASELRLHAYAPTCRALSDPPYEFNPKELLEPVEVAMQLEHGVSLTRTLKPLAVVAAQVLLLLADELSLHAYAPTCRALSNPPNEFAP
jgi:hypothetical protein